MNVGTAGMWEIKFNNDLSDSRWYTTLYSKTGESASDIIPPVCNTTSGVDMEGMMARTVFISFTSGNSPWVNVYLKGVWDDAWLPTPVTSDDTNRGAWFKLIRRQSISFSLGPCGLDGNSHTPLGNCNRGIIEIEVPSDQGIRKTAVGYFAVTSGGTWL